MSRSHTATPIATTRRKFLRGLGACIALPTFQSLGPGNPLNAAAVAGKGLATTRTGAPLRTVFISFPNGAIPSAWWPTRHPATGEWKLSETLKPLENVRDQIQVLAELDHATAEAGDDGAGDHARGNGTFLTATRLKKSATDIRAGISIDQLIADHVGVQTRFSSLELSCDPARTSGTCDSGYSCAYQYNLSWRSPTMPMAAESNPRQAFERLFGAGDAEQRRINLQQRRAADRSLLDFVLDDARSLRRRLGQQDRQKLDEYLTSVRAIEQQIARAEEFGDPPAIDRDTPAGIPEDYGAYIGLMFYLIRLAFETDSTRIATLMLAHDGSNRSFQQIDVSEGHHDLSHHQNKEDWVNKLKKIDRWYVQQFAAFLEKLNGSPDMDGNSMLHNSMILYGSGNADGNRHSHSNLPLILAGGGGGTLQPGRYLQNGSRPAANLFVSLANRMGARIDSFGDSTGSLENI